MRFFGNKSVLVALVGLAFSAMVWIIALWPGDPLQRIDRLVFDSYQRILPRQWADSPITVVDIDERSIRALGQWPWPRSTVADLTDRLGQLGAATIVFDIVFSEPDRTSPLKALDLLRQAGAMVIVPNRTDMLDNDIALARAFERNRVVTGMVFADEATSDPPPPKAGHGFSGTVPTGLMKKGRKAVRNLPLLDEAAMGIGEFGFLATGDGIVRKAQLLKPANGNWYPALAVETLRVAQGAGGFKIKASDGSGEIDVGDHAIVSIQVGAFEVPTDRVGAIDIYHSHAASKPTLSVIDVLSPPSAQQASDRIKGLVEGRVVLIGTSAQGLLDLRATPLEPIVPGVTIHAEIIDQIISGTYISRPDYAKGVELLMAILTSLVLVLLLPRLKTLGDALATTTMLAIAIGTFWIMFAEYQLLFSPVVAILSLLAAYAAGSTAELLVTEKEGRFVRDAFGRYLAPALVEKLADDPSQLQLGGEERELTLLFCDIRGFTSLSEGLDPTELTALLNDFLTPMTEALLERGATIDKYMGDAIMAFWNAPIAQEDHRQQACEGLLDMRSALIDLNAMAARPIAIGIGLNTGPCCVGNLGSSQRFNYSAIGDAVNVASRIEGLTKFYGLDNLVSEETLMHSEGLVTFEIDLVSVVGREEPLRVFTIAGRISERREYDLAKLQDRHQAMLQLYREGETKGAMGALDQASEIAPPELHYLYALYRERLDDLATNGVPEGWDGVYRATSK